MAMILWALIGVYLAVCYLWGTFLILRLFLGKPVSRLMRQWTAKWRSTPAVAVE